MPLELADTAPVATLTNVSASATSVGILAANAARKGAIVTNDSTALMYLAYDTTASATHYTVMLPGSVAGVAYMWEMPPGEIYTGPLSALWASATGSGRATEY